VAAGDRRELADQGGSEEHQAERDLVEVAQLAALAENTNMTSAATMKTSPVPLPTTKNASPSAPSIVTGSPGLNSSSCIVRDVLQLGRLEVVEQRHLLGSASIAPGPRQ
jgi:hypothetical protein